MNKKIDQYERKRNLRYKKPEIPRAEPVAVQIEKSAKPGYWYKKYIGHVVKAMPMGDNYVVLPFDTELMFLIDQKDCRQINHLN